MFCSIIEALLLSKCVAEVCVWSVEIEKVVKGWERGGEGCLFTWTAVKTDINQNTLTDLRLPPLSLCLRCISELDDQNMKL